MAEVQELSSGHNYKDKRSDATHLSRHSQVLKAPVRCLSARERKKLFASKGKAGPSRLSRTTSATEPRGPKAYPPSALRRLSHVVPSTNLDNGKADSFTITHTAGNYLDNSKYNFWQQGAHEGTSDSTLPSESWGGYALRLSKQVSRIQSAGHRYSVQYEGSSALEPAAAAAVPLAYSLDPSRMRPHENASSVDSTRQNSVTGVNHLRFSLEHLDLDDMVRLGSDPQPVMHDDPIIMHHVMSHDSSSHLPGGCSVCTSERGDPAPRSPAYSSCDSAIDHTYSVSDDSTSCCSGAESCLRVSLESSTASSTATSAGSLSSTCTSRKRLSDSGLDGSGGSKSMSLASEASLGTEEVDSALAAAIQQFAAVRLPISMSIRDRLAVPTAGSANTLGSRQAAAPQPLAGLQTCSLRTGTVQRTGTVLPPASSSVGAHHPQVTTGLPRSLCTTESTLQSRPASAPFVSSRSGSSKALSTLQYVTPALTMASTKRLSKLAAGRKPVRTTAASTGYRSTFITSAASVSQTKTCGTHHVALLRDVRSIPLAALKVVYQAEQVQGSAAVERKAQHSTLPSTNVAAVPLCGSSSGTKTLQKLSPASASGAPQGTPAGLIKQAALLHDAAKLKDKSQRLQVISTKLLEASHDGLGAIPKRHSPHQTRHVAAAHKVDGQKTPAHLPDERKRQQRVQQALSCCFSMGGSNMPAVRVGSSGVVLGLKSTAHTAGCSTLSTPKLGTSSSCHAKNAQACASGTVSTQAKDAACAAKRCVGPMTAAKQSGKPLTARQMRGQWADISLRKKDRPRTVTMSASQQPLLLPLQGLQPLIKCANSSSSSPASSPKLGISSSCHAKNAQACASGTVSTQAQDAACAAKRCVGPMTAAK